MEKSICPLTSHVAEDTGLHESTESCLLPISTLKLPMSVGTQVVVLLGCKGTYGEEYAAQVIVNSTVCESRNR